MNPFLDDLPDNIDELTIPLIAHRIGSRGLDLLREEAMSDPASWPDEWKIYERKEYPRFDATRLSLSSQDVPTSRRSTRHFTGQELSLKELSHVLEAVRIWRGENHSARESPSAGGLFPVECYALLKGELAEGRVGYYDAEEHEIVLTLQGRSDVFDDPTNTIGTSVVVGAAAFIVLTSVMYRTMRKYGARGYRYALMEAGAVAQEIDRRARSIGLGTCWLGGFDDEGLAELIGCRAGVDMEIPLLVLAVGRTPSGDGAAARP
jgi:SagB-type dehydrogenase family enzyme